jgi:hypothetical protein
MEIPSEVITAKELLESPLFEAGLITGIDFGVRDDENPDFEDLAMRIFVKDASNIPTEVEVAVQDFTQTFSFPVVVIQRVFLVTQTTTLPDTSLHRPILGGISVASSRFASIGVIHAGTLGAIVTDSFNPMIRYGLSNYHVLCVDDNRQEGDEIIQPEKTTLGIGNRIGSLHAWSFPETTMAGRVDAAICILDPDVDSVQEVVDIGSVSGVVPATLGMLVTKRGRTTGQTFGIVCGVGAVILWTIHHYQRLLHPLVRQPRCEHSRTRLRLKLIFPSQLFSANMETPVRL